MCVDLIWSMFGMFSCYLSTVRVALSQLDGHDEVAAKAQKALQDSDCINFDLCLQTFFSLHHWVELCAR